MGAFYVMLIVMILSSTLADIAWDDKALNENIKILFQQDYTERMETKIRDSVNDNTRFFKSNPVKVLRLGLDLVPYLSKAFEVASVLEGLFTDEKEWSQKFSTMYRSETIRHDKEIQMVDMGDKMTHVKREIRNIRRMIGNETELDKLNSTQTETVKDLIATVRPLLSDMIIKFGKHDSPFKDDPMVGAPVLAEIALLVAAFESLAINLYPSIINIDKYSCRIFDVMRDYLTFMMVYRFDKVRNVNFKRMLEVRNAPLMTFGEHGYETSQSLHCNFISDRYDCQRPKGIICYR